MSSSLNTSSVHDGPFDHDGWWEELGLRFERVPATTRHPRETEQAARAVLAAHPPIAFADDVEGRTLTTAQLDALVRHAVEEAEQAAERRREAGAEERRRLGRANVEAALTAEGATEAIVDGRWAGFTRGEATAWCWNLFQYEPHGFVHPASQVRHAAVQVLEAGGLPEVFDYPERARELAARGLDPRAYRRHKEALGAGTFTEADARRR